MESGRRALLASLLTLLRDRPPTGLGLRAEDTGLTSNGRPPAVGGPYYYGLHSGGRAWEIGTSLIERPRLHVTVTARVTVGADKIGPAVIEGPDGLGDKVAAVVRFLGSRNHDYDWFNAANALLGPDVNGYKFLGLRFEESDPVEVGPEWFLAGPATPGRRSDPAPAGVKATLTISGFEREQYVETFP